MDKNKHYVPESRNVIEGFRTQEERPQSPEERNTPGRICPKCKGKGEITYNKPSLSITDDCSRCGGEGLIYE